MWQEYLSVIFSLKIFSPSKSERVIQSGNWKSYDILALCACKFYVGGMTSCERIASTMVQANIPLTYLTGEVTNLERLVKPDGLRPAGSSRSRSVRHVCELRTVDCGRRLAFTHNMRIVDATNCLASWLVRETSPLQLAADFHPIWFRKRSWK